MSSKQTNREKNQPHFLWTANGVCRIMIVAVGVVVGVVVCVCARSLWHFAVLPNKGEKGVFTLSLLSIIFIFVFANRLMLSSGSLFVDQRFYKIQLKIHELDHPYRVYERETIFAPKNIGIFPDYIGFLVTIFFVLL